VEAWDRTEAGPEYPTLARIVASAQRRWWLLVVGALVGAGLALAAGGNGDKTYQAHTKLLVGSNGGQFSVLRAAGQQAETYADLANSQPVLQRARQRLGTKRTLAQLRDSVAASADSVTRLLTVTASGRTPAEAASTANAVAAELQSTSRSRDPKAPNQLNVVEPAERPSRPLNESSRALVGIAALAGLLGMLTLLVVIDLLRGRVATEEELASASPAPVLGTAGRDRAGLLGAAALLGDHYGRIAVVGVDDDSTGAQTALALATALATGGNRVLVVDVDPGRHSLTRRLRLEGRAGAVETLGRGSGMRRADLTALTVAYGPRVAVLPRGRGPLEASRAEALLHRVARLADVLVISGPAVLGSSAGLGWSRLADGSILAVRRGHATRDHVAGAVELLQRSDAVVLGTVLARTVRRRRPPRPVPVPAADERREPSTSSREPATTATDGATRA
jgi:tyrosine-protein kinase